MSYRIEIREEADAEIFDAYHWYEQQLTGLGQRFINELEIVLEKITSNPLHYKIATSIYRQAAIKSFPFVVYFEVNDNAIIVYSVFHTKRKPKTDFSFRIKR